jgi:hypothetical protein
MFKPEGRWRPVLHLEKLSDENLTLAAGTG